MKANKVLRREMYSNPIRGRSLFTDIPVEIIGEQTVEVNGKIEDQYIYNIVGYKPENGKPFIGLKCNYIIE